METINALNKWIIITDGEGNKYRVRIDHSKVDSTGTKKIEFMVEEWKRFAGEMGWHKILGTVKLVK